MVEKLHLQCLLKKFQVEVGPYSSNPGQLYFFFFEINLTIPVKVLNVHSLLFSNSTSKIFFYKKYQKARMYAIQISIVIFFFKSKNQGLHKKSQRMKGRNSQVNLAKTPMPSEALVQLKLYLLHFFFWVCVYVCVCKIFSKQSNYFQLRFPICLKKIKYTLALSPMERGVKINIPKRVLQLWIKVTQEQKSLLYCSLS